MKLLALLGLEGRLRRLRIAAGEGAMAAEDRAQLLRMAWDGEKQRLKSMLLLVVLLLGLTTVTVAMVSVAVVVNFWETRYRVTAAWSVAAVWVVLWMAALAGLWGLSRHAAGSVSPVRDEFGRDWAWLRARFGAGEADEHAAPAPRRPATRDELRARIARQRQRIAVISEPGPPAAPDAPPADESMSAAALRVARAHPVASGVAAAAVVALLGPRRVLRWAALAAPFLWRLR